MLLQYKAREGLEYLQIVYLSNHSNKSYVYV